MRNRLVLLPGWSLGTASLHPLAASLRAQDPSWGLRRREAAQRRPDGRHHTYRDRSARARKKPATGRRE